MGTKTGRRHRPGPRSRAAARLGVLGAALYFLSIVLFLMAGAWWLLTRVWEGAPGGAGVLAGVALALYLVGGTLASVTGEANG